MLYKQEFARISTGEGASWGWHGPSPQIVFEFASEETWKRDLTVKPRLYAEFGVEEYYAFDPNDPILPASRKRGQRLFAWRRDRASNLLLPAPVEDRRVWSPRLQSYLVENGYDLLLLDHRGQKRLTRAEAEAQRAEEADQRAGEVKRRAEEAIERARMLEEKLCGLGIDPSQFV